MMRMEGVVSGVVLALVLLGPRVASAAPSPVVARADRICEGHVSSVGVPWHFPDGRIDWRFNATTVHGPYTVEWTVQLNRMGLWMALAAAYRETRDEKYARCFARQLRDWLDQTGGGIPPEAGYNRGESLFRTIEEGIRLGASWIDAWKAFGESPAFTPELKESFVRSCRAQAKHALAHRSQADNWLLIEMRGVFVFASEFPDLPESREQRRQSAAILLDAFRKQMLPDGMHYELTPDYHAVVMDSAASVYAKAQEKGFFADLPGDFTAILERGGEATLALTTPSFVQPRFNDCYTVSAETTLGWCARLFPERADFRWGVTRRREGTPPAGETASRVLPYAGFAAMRSDWGPEATYLAFDFGPLGYNHCHQDKLSFTLWKGGEELVFEDGGGQYDVSPHRRYACSGYGHNVLLVDGLAQERSEPRVAETPIDCGWTSNARFDFAKGVYDQGFGPERKRLARHERKIGFEKPDRFRIQDVVTAADGAAHDYELLFHVDTTNVAVAADGRSLRAHFGRKWDLELVVQEGGTLSTAVGQTKPRLAGWYVGRGDRSLHPATTISVRAPKRTKDHRFITRLTPIEATAPNAGR